MHKIAIARNRQVVNRLEAQLKKGTKPTKEGVDVPLTDKDITRINKELGIVKERLDKVSGL